MAVTAGRSCGGYRLGPHQIPDGDSGSQGLSAAVRHLERRKQSRVSGLRGG